MPLYEYQCTQCGHRFEVLQRMGEGGDGLSCPSCQAPRPEKKFSTFAASAGPGSASAAASAGTGAACCRGPGFT